MVVVNVAVPKSSSVSGTATNINQDLAAYDRRFRLPAAHVEVVPRFAGSASPSLATGEEVLDVEMIHAVAPGAAIRVVLIDTTHRGGVSTALPVYLDALRYAVDQHLGDVISISLSVGEHCFTRTQVGALHSVLQAARDHHVSVVGSSGDFGAVGKPCRGKSQPFAPVKEVGLPASDPLVTAAGGTKLDADRSTGAYVGESAWSSPPALEARSHSSGSGGGFSRWFARPAYQNGVPGASGQRGVPDVAGDADPATGLALVAERPGVTYTVAGGGTSASAPFWAAVAALADQDAGRRLGFLNAGLYRIGLSGEYAKAFHAVTTGTNTVTFPPKHIVGYQARRGWDPVTGWGSPDAQVLVPLLGRNIQPGDGRGL